MESIMNNHRRLSSVQSHKHKTASQHEVLQTRLIPHKNGVYQGQCLIAAAASFAGARVIKHGLGVFAYDNGDFYFGEWDSDSIQGEGMLFLAFGGFVHGFFSNYRLQGPALMQLADGEVYEGCWEKGKLEGDVLNYYIDEDFWIQSAYVNGRFVRVVAEGQGREEHSSILSRRFSSSTQLSAKHRTSENPRVKVVNFTDGSQFLGACDQATPQGLGCIRRASGLCDVGTFEGGRAVGFTRLNLAGGRVYDGELRNGKFHGKGVVFDQRNRSWVLAKFDSEGGRQPKVIQKGRGEYPLDVIQNIKVNSRSRDKHYSDVLISERLFDVPEATRVFNDDDKELRIQKAEGQAESSHREKASSNVKSQCLGKAQQQLQPRQISPNSQRKATPGKARYSSANARLYNYFKDKEINLEQRRKGKAEEEEEEEEEEERVDCQTRRIVSTPTVKLQKTTGGVHSQRGKQKQRQTAAEKEAEELIDLLKSYDFKGGEEVSNRENNSNCNSNNNLGSITDRFREVSIINSQFRSQTAFECEQSAVASKSTVVAPSENDERRIQVKQTGKGKQRLLEMLPYRAETEVKEKIQEKKLSVGRGGGGGYLQLGEIKQNKQVVFDQVKAATAAEIAMVVAVKEVQVIAATIVDAEQRSAQGLSYQVQEQKKPSYFLNEDQQQQQQQQQQVPPFTSSSSGTVTPLELVNRTDEKKSPVTAIIAKDNFLLSSLLSLPQSVILSTSPQSISKQAFTLDPPPPLPPSSHEYELKTTSQPTQDSFQQLIQTRALESVKPKLLLQPFTSAPIIEVNYYEEEESMKYPSFDYLDSIRHLSSFKLDSMSSPLQAAPTDAAGNTPSAAATGNTPPPALHYFATTATVTPLTAFRQTQGGGDTYKSVIQMFACERTDSWRSSQGGSEQGESRQPTEEKQRYSVINNYDALDIQTNTVPQLNYEPSLNQDVFHSLLPSSDYLLHKLPSSSYIATLSDPLAITLSIASSAESQAKPYQLQVRDTLTEIYPTNLHPTQSSSTKDSYFSSLQTRFNLSSDDTSRPYHPAQRERVVLSQKDLVDGEGSSSMRVSSSNVPPYTPLSGITFTDNTSSQLKATSVPSYNPITPTRTSIYNESTLPPIISSGVSQINAWTSFTEIPTSLKASALISNNNYTINPLSYLNSITPSSLHGISVARQNSQLYENAEFPKIQGNDVSCNANQDAPQIYSDFWTPLHAS